MMKISFQLLIVVAAGCTCVQGRTAVDKICTCTSEFNPVCGSDGITYNNTCQAICSGVSVVYKVPCRSKTTAQPAKYASRSCMCIADYDPVCGTDGRTYSNSCEAGCSGVSVVHEGSCGSKTTPTPVKFWQPSCICPAIYAPVCGTDGRTYSNGCWAKCGGGVSVAYEGACKSRTTTPSAEYSPRSCICIAIYAPVCGTDGVTYSNDCRARCSGVSVAYEGACKSKTTTPFAEYSPRSCICIAIYAPVCGTDGVTYSNDCRARCSGVSVAYDGACTSRTTAQPIRYSRRPCICPLNYAPVCGTDGRTHGNECRAECNGVSVAYDGACTSRTTAQPIRQPRRPCICPDNYAPVCGTDGRTHGNECRAECKNVTEYVMGACSDVCTCSKAYEPVCHVTTGTQYVNRCYARCLGVDSTLLKSCNNKPIQRPSPRPRPRPSTQGYRPRPRPRPNI